MKKTLSTMLIFIWLGTVASAHANEDAFLPGEYKIIAYSLSNGSSETHSDVSVPTSISFHSLYISPAAMDTVLNRDDVFLENSLLNIDKDSYKGFAIGAAYSPTPSLTFRSTIGVTDTIEARSVSYKDRVGWEVDLGLAYKFLDNFAYELHFGYMDTGELFKESNTYTDVDSITIITNKLTMSF